MVACQVRRAAGDCRRVSREKDNEDLGAGCGCVLLIVAIALVVAAAMSLAALVDPFDWYPSFDELWADCDDDFDTAQDECSYEQRFPGFWWHLAVNLAYAVAALVALLVFAGTVAEFRERRVARLCSAATYATYEQARAALRLSAVGVAILAALPIVVVVL